MKTETDKQRQKANKEVREIMRAIKAKVCVAEASGSPWIGKLKQKEYGKISGSRNS